MYNILLNFISFMVILFFFVYIIFNIQSLKSKLMVKYCYLIIFIYLIISTYQFLNNSLKYGKYVAFQQRFWKIAYLSFWLIELFLFFLLTYFTFISPSETFYVLDSRKNFYIFNFFSYTFSWSTLLLVSVAFFFFWFSHVKYKKYYNFVCVYSIICFVFLNIYFFTEFLKFYYVVQHFKYKIQNFIDINTPKNNFSYLNTNYLYYYKKSIWIYKARTQHFFIMLLVLVKFWHIFFVYLFFLFYYKELANQKNLNHDIFSYNMQNFAFLIFFNFYTYVLMFKKYMYFLVIIDYVKRIFLINYSLVKSEITILIYIFTL